MALSGTLTPHLQDTTLLLCDATGETILRYTGLTAYVFAKPGGGWADTTETEKPTASDGAWGDLFGYSVAISGDTVVVGTYGDSIGANTEQGSAYVFGPYKPPPQDESFPWELFYPAFIKKR